MKRALITGANRGLGLETARQLARKEFEVWLGSRDLAEGELAARGLIEQALSARAVQLDVTDVATLAAAQETVGAIDSLVCNAGVALKDFNLRVVEDTLAVNYFGVVHAIDAFYPKAIKKGGAIVVVSSGLGELSILSPALQEKFRAPSLTRKGLDLLLAQFVRDVSAGRHEKEGWPSSAYGVSKVAVNALVRILARDEREIAINAVCPGWVRTRMGGSSAPRSVEEGADTIAWAATLSPPTTGKVFRDRTEVGW